MTHPQTPDSERDRLRSAAQKARTALSSLIASGDRVVFSDALRALDEVLGTSNSVISKNHITESNLVSSDLSAPGRSTDAALRGSGIGSGQ